MSNHLVDAWEIHARINHFLLDAIAPDALGVAPPSATKAASGRTVGEVFAHLHNVRLMWLKVAAPDLLEGLDKVEKEHASDKSLLAAALHASDPAIARLIGDAVAADGKVKGFKPHVGAFTGYLISHESHHRGQLALTLKQAGRPLDKKVAYGMWEWGVR